MPSVPVFVLLPALSSREEVHWTVWEDSGLWEMLHAGTPRLSEYMLIVMSIIKKKISFSIWLVSGAK